MSIGTLGASLLGKLSAGKGTIETSQAGPAKMAEQNTIRAAESTTISKILKCRSFIKNEPKFNGAF